MAMSKPQLQLPPWCDSVRFDTHQRPVVEEIVARYDEGNRLVVVDAPTGAGKTIIAEAVRQSLETCGMYLCTTLTLMDQFLGDFDEAKLIKGRANYTPQEPEPDYLGNVPTCADCDWDSVSELCTFCLESELCPYTVAKNAAARAQLPCSNTAYFMGECNSSRSVFSGQDFVILDEADAVEGEVMNYVGISISATMQKRLGLKPPDKKTVESSWERWFEYAIPIVERKYKTSPRKSLQDRRRRQTVKRLLDRLTAVAENLEGWVYTGYRQNAIEFKPVMVDKIAPEVLWSHGQRWLAMSATIISPEEFVSSLGWNDSWAPVFAPSTFEPAKRPIYFVPSAKMTKKTEVEAWPEMGEALRVVIDRHPDERILVHTHSYSLTKFLKTDVAGSGYVTKSQRFVFSYLNSKERQSAIGNFEEFPASVLLAPSLDRGYDGKDDLVRVVVVCKMPHAYIGDKQVEKRLYGTEGGELWYATQTARSFVQMVGRGMRHEDDYAICYVLDSGFSRFYGDWTVPEEDDRREHRSHLLFPNWFLDALHLNSDVRFDIRHEVLRRRKEGLAQGLTAAVS